MKMTRFSVARYERNHSLNQKDTCRLSKCLIIHKN